MTLAMRLMDSFVTPKESGRAFYVKAGQILRVIEVEGPQTCDLNAWNAQNFAECFSAGRTRFFTGVHPKKGDSLWSVPPHERKMMTIIEDTSDHIVGPHGEESHDLLFPRCSPIVFEYPFGVSNPTSCQENLTTAVAPHGLAPEDIHDTLNLFMRTGVDRSGHIFIAEPDARKGDFVDLLAHMDLLVAISACPAGAIHATQDINRPLRIERYDVLEA